MEGLNHFLAWYYKDERLIIHGYYYISKLEPSLNMHNLLTALYISFVISSGNFNIKSNHRGVLNGNRQVVLINLF